MKCPGQDSQYWKPGAIFNVKCPKCQTEVEFFKDDTTRKCSKCGHRFLNPQLDFGCASYCQYAEQCIGDLPPELLAQKEDLLKDRVAIEMKRYLRRDFQQIGHASRVARYAEQIGREENGNLAVILCAAYLYNIGIKAAEEENLDSTSEHRANEGPLIAREILIKLGAKEPLIDEVCDIIAHHSHPGGDESINFMSVHDADQLATLEEKQKEEPVNAEKLTEIIEKSLFTDSGRRIGKKKLLE